MLISVIIPTLNEAGTITTTLNHTLNLDGDKEILVVDGGSTDGTQDLAAKYARVISAPKGRANQMNAGAASASGEVLLFLHSDSLLPKKAFLNIKKALSQHNVVGGAFRLRIDDHALVFRLIEAGSNARARFFKIYFGDQAIFSRRETFFASGGYPDIPIMEDWELGRALQKQGRMVLLPSQVTTSARRWQLHGTWRTIFLMHKLKFYYKMGMPPERLKSFYDDTR